jgi:hypothetical protein
LCLSGGPLPLVQGQDGEQVRFFLQKTSAVGLDYFGLLVIRIQKNRFPSTNLLQKRDKQKFSKAVTSGKKKYLTIYIKNSIEKEFSIQHFSFSKPVPIIFEKRQKSIPFGGGPYSTER